MPYWNRAEALSRSLSRYIELYKSDAIEIVIVDDGSSEKPFIPAYSPFPVRLITLPQKVAGLNPCLPINIGVKAAEGDIIFLTNPEIVHSAKILDPMVRELERLGRTGYVSAACWCPKLKMWLCRSDVPDVPGRAKMPKGAGLHFFSGFHKSLFDSVGGFDDEYRDGQGYEDNDFLWKIHSAGAKFKILDECTVEHGAAPRVAWPSGGTARNRAIFERKWGS
jgi:GT2 family glycosyltransferase